MDSSTELENEEAPAIAETDEKTGPGEIPLIKFSDLAGEKVQSLFELGTTKVVKSPVLEYMSDVQKEFDLMLQQAEAIRNAAVSERERIREEARTEGLEQGYAEVLETLAIARAEYGKLQDGAQGDMLTLAFGIARRIIKRTLELEPSIVNEIVRDQLEYARGRRSLTILVHPDDLESVEKSRELYVDELEGAAVYFDADPSINRGGCVIETESGRIDARLEVQLAILRDAIEKE